MSKERTREKQRLRKKVQCVETVALEACSCFEASERERNCEKRSFQFAKRSGFRGVLVFEASERKRGGLHVESAIDSKERKGDSTERGTERTKRKSGFEAGRQERRL